MRAYQQNEWVVIVLPPRFSSQRPLQFSVLASDHMQKGQVKFIIDASRLKFVDSGGIGILLRQLVKVQDFGGEMRIRGLQGDALALFKEMNVLRVFEMDTHSSNGLRGTGTVGG